MIKKVINYTVICDSCKADALEHDEYSSWGDVLYQAKEIERYE